MSVLIAAITCDRLVTIKVTPEEAKIVKRVLEKKKQKLLKATFTENYQCIEVTGDKENLREFAELGIKLVWPADFQNTAYLLREKADALDRINKEGLIREKFEWDAVRNFQKTIDKWDGEFVITNPVPTDRRPCKPE